MSDDAQVDGRELRRQLEVEQSAVARLKERAAAPVDRARIDEEGRAQLATLDAALGALETRRADAEAQVEAHRQEARRLDDARLLLGDTEPLDGLSPAMMPLMAFVAVVVELVMRHNPFRDVPRGTMVWLCLGAVGVPMLLLPLQAYLMGRRGAAVMRRR